MTPPEPKVIDNRLNDLEDLDRGVDVGEESGDDGCTGIVGNKGCHWEGGREERDAGRGETWCPVVGRGAPATVRVQASRRGTGGVETSGVLGKLDKTASR